MKRFLFLLTLSMLTAVSGAAKAAPTPVGNQIVNGGFESTFVANNSWVNVAATPGWTWLGGPGTGFELRNNAVGRAQEGRNFIELDTNGNSLIGQYLDNLSTGALYDLTFWYAPRTFQPASTNGLQVFWNGAQLGDVLTRLGGSENDWTQHQFSVNAQAGRNLLSFAAAGTSDGLGGNLDNVQLNRIPEPGSLMLTLAALAAAFLLPRTLRRQAVLRRATALASTLERTTGS